MIGFALRPWQAARARGLVDMEFDDDYVLRPPSA